MVKRILFLDRSDTTGKTIEGYVSMLTSGGYEVERGRYISDVIPGHRWGDTTTELTRFDLAMVHPEIADVKVLEAELRRREAFRDVLYQKGNISELRDFEGRVRYIGLPDADGLLKIVREVLGE